MKPSLPKGTRDFNPLETSRRRYIFEIIRQNFELFGYQSIETPAMEKLETLTGKYGEEGDRLIFKILNSGKFIEDSELLISEEKISDAKKQMEEQGVNGLPLSGFLDESSITKRIAEKALRYDLTVPFARFVAMNREKITFPFRRYQIQPVWRADRPQKGRYREFWQCDADVVGSESLLNEAELIQIYDRVFYQLNLPVKIQLNNRKILNGIAEIMGFSDKFVSITTAIDKLDKIGLDRVEEELIQSGLSADSIGKLRPFLTLKGSNLDKLDFLQKSFEQSETGRKGVEEIKTILEYFNGSDSLSLKSAIIELDICLARGLNYYTGSIVEVKALDIDFGSLGG